MTKMLWNLLAGICLSITVPHGLHATSSVGPIQAPDGKWLITSLSIGGTLTDISSKGYQLEFRASEKQMATRICNIIRGGYSIEGNTIKAGNLVSTKMWCADMENETAFNKAIMEIDNFEYNGDQMLLKKGKDILIILTILKVE